VSERLFYIRNVGSERGDLALWWGPDRCGYTTNVANAGVYSEAEARSIHDGRGEDVAIAKELVDANTFAAVGIDRVRTLPPAWEKRRHCEECWGELAAGTPERVLLCPSCASERAARSDDDDSEDPS
jgi:hypothetical protein